MKNTQESTQNLVNIIKKETLQFTVTVTHSSSENILVFSHFLTANQQASFTKFYRNVKKILLYKKFHIFQEIVLFQGTFSSK